MRIFGLIFFTLFSIRLAASEVQKNILFYLSGDNNLTGMMGMALEKISEYSGSVQHNILILMDGDQIGDSKLIALTKDGKRIIKKNFETDMGDEEVLFNFISLAKNEYPAKETILYIFAHGRGILNVPVNDGSAFGEANENTPLTLAVSSDDSTRSYIDETELSQRLAPLFKNDKIDLLVFNSCLMGNLEIMNILAEFAHYAVASEFTICVNAGLSESAYEHHGVSATKILDLVKENPFINPIDIGKSLVDTFKVSYEKFYIPTNFEEVERCSSTLALYDLSHARESIKILNRVISELRVALSSDVSGALLEKITIKLMNTIYVDSYGYLDLQALLSILDESGFSTPWIEKLTEKLKELVPYGVGLHLDAEKSALVSLYFPPLESNQEIFEKFDRNYSALPSLKETILPAFLTEIRHLFLTRKEQLIFKWVSDLTKGKPPTLRPKADASYNEYYILLLADLVIYDLKARGDSLQLEEYLKMISETDYESEKFLKHRSEIKKFIESEPKAEGF